MSKTPPRLQRLILRLQPYELKIRYVPGKYQYLADTSSRAYIPGEANSDIDEDLIQVVHSLVTNLPVTTTKLEKIQQATANDKLLQKIMHYTWPRSQKNLPLSLRPYWHIRDSLHLADNIVFTHQRIVVPRSLQAYMLPLIHESHFGIEKSKARARDLLYWPKMNADIERIIGDCELCIKFQNKQQREPLLSHKIFNERYFKVGMDVLTIQNKDYLVIVDYYSKYPELLQFHDKTARTIVEQCKSVFSRHSIPVEVVSDNYAVSKCKIFDFCQSLGN